MSSIDRPTIIRYLDAHGNRVTKQTPGAKKVKEKCDTWRGKFKGADGVCRSVTLYLTALFTGLRASELASLTESSFDLTTNPPTVTVGACYSKHRCEDVLPLHAALATQLGDWLVKCRQTAQQAISDESETLPIRPASAPSPNGKRSAKTVSAKPVERIWPGTWIERSAEMLRDDLEAASIPYSTDDGVFDFHAFRHQFITSLAKNGVHPKLAQTLTRHSTITLTMDRYSHVGLLDMTTALGSLPCVPTPIEQIALATGTDDAAGCTMVAPMVALDPPKLTFHQVPSDAFSVSEIESIATSENPHFPLGNEGCLIPVITGDNEWDRWDSNPEPKDYESSALTD